MHRGLLGISVVHMATEEEKLNEALITQIGVELVERKMLQKDLAAAMKIEAATLNRYLKSKRGISMAVFYKMAAGLGMTPGELMERVELRVEKNS